MFHPIKNTKEVFFFESRVQFIPDSRRRAENEFEMFEAKESAHSLLFQLSNKILFHFFDFVECSVIFLTRKIYVMYALSKAFFHWWFWFRSVVYCQLNTGMEFCLMCLEQRKHREKKIRCLKKARIFNTLYS